MSLTEKQKAFCHEYFMNRGNGTDAYMKAYDGESRKGASVEASRLLEKEAIRDYLAQLAQPCREREKADRERVQAILWKMILDADTSNTDRLKAIDIVNKLGANYRQVETAGEQKANLSILNLDTLQTLAGLSTKQDNTQNETVHNTLLSQDTDNTISVQSIN